MQLCLLPNIDLMCGLIYFSLCGLLTLLISLSIEANIVGPPTEAFWSVSTLFVEKSSKTFQQRTKHTTLVVIGALRVNKAFKFFVC